MSPEPPLPVPARDARPVVARPDDFDAFWSSTLASLRDVPIDYRVGTVTRAPEGVRLEPVRYRSFGNVEIQGFYLRPDPTAGAPAAPRPLVITTHGYNSRCNPTLEARHARTMDVFCFDVRGFGLSQRACAVDPDGYVLTGLTSPETSILRGAVADYIRAAEVALRLRRTTETCVVFHGRSFAGALAFMAEALSALARFLVVSVPTLGWAEGRRALVKDGSGREINDYLARVPSHDAAIMHTLSYFDTVNFANRVRCPTIVGVGMRDDIVPAETVYAIVNHMSPLPEVIELPVSHSTDLEEARWQEFDARWAKRVETLCEHRESAESSP